MKDSRELIKGEKGKKEEAVKKENPAVNTGIDQGIDQVQFKNLVKNRLIKDKERNKENAANADYKLQNKQSEIQKTTVI
jgi:hypothetical protein